jgi:molybdenum-dependent DNA-binding transcriptional regulator ModE
MTEFTEAAQNRFLKKLAEVGTIKRAARDAKVSRSAVYHRKGRDQTFAKLMAAALKGNNAVARERGLMARHAETRRTSDAAANRRANGRKMIRREMTKA